MTWSPPNLTLKWGPYTKPDAEEQLKAVQTVQAALGGTAGVPIITMQLAVEKLRQSGVFDIDNVAAVIEELEAKAAEKKAEDEATAERDLDHAVTQIQAKAEAAPTAKPPVKK